MSIEDLPTRATFGLPKSDDASIIVTNPPDEVLRGAEYTTLGDALIELFEDHGLSDGSTEGSLWEYARKFAGAVDTAIWREGEPSPHGNVYATLFDAMKALSFVPTRATLIVDTSLAVGSFEDEHELACKSLYIVGINGTSGTVLASEGFSIVGSLTEIHIVNMELSWNGSTAAYTSDPGHNMQLYLDHARISSSGGTGFMFEFNLCTVYMNALSQMSGGANEVIKSDGSVTFVLDGAQCYLGGNVVRGDATVGVYYSSVVSVTPQPQVNLTNPIITLDAAAPYIVDESGPAVSWTTQKGIRHGNVVSLSVYTMDASLVEWPVGETRRLKQYSASVFGYQLAVPSGHKLNGVLNGVTGTLAASDMQVGNPVRTHPVTREGMNEWSWTQEG